MGEEIAEAMANPHVRSRIAGEMRQREALQRQIERLERLTQGAIEAMKGSFMGCLKNILPFLVYGVIMFVLASVLWFFLLGWIVHLWSIIDAALYRRPT